MDNQPFGMPIGKFGIPGQHVVGQDRDVALPERRHLRSQEVKREVRMHPPVRAREVGITVHVLGEHSRSVHMCCQQSIAELVRVEALGKPRHMPRCMVFDVNLPPWAGPPGGDAGIDPESLGDTAGIRNCC